MTSWSLRPASRASNAPADWMPSCEFPARRMTASLMFCGRRSALPATGIDEEANSGRAEGVLTNKPSCKYQDSATFVNRFSVLSSQCRLSVRTNTGRELNHRLHRLHGFEKGRETL